MVEELKAGVWYNRRGTRLWIQPDHNQEVPPSGWTRVIQARQVYCDVGYASSSVSLSVDDMYDMCTPQVAELLQEIMTRTVDPWKI